MSVKIKRSNEKLEKILQQLSQNPKSKIRIGVKDADVAEYATYVEYGWSQRVTVKQALFLSNALGKPVAAGKNGMPNVKAAAVKPGTTLVMQPRPFMRTTVAEKQKSWIHKLGRIFANSHDSAQSLALVGQEAVSDIKQTIASGGSGGMKFDKRKPMTMEMYKRQAEGKRISKGSVDVSNLKTDKPLVNSGKLLKSISFWVSD
nr:MAG TPA: virion morphogenesis protein [Caudoviricetes sp.]